MQASTPAEPSILRPMLGSVSGLGWLVIVVLSLVPGSLRPHTGMSSAMEIFAAYFVVVAIGCVALRTGAGRIGIGILLTLTAALMELLQLAIPGRDAGWAGFTWAVLGTWGAIALVTVILGAKSIRS